MSTLEVRGLTKRHGDAEVVRDVSFSIEPGEVLALLGASGAGKTTIALMVAGLSRPSAGRVLLDGEGLEAPRPRDQRRLVQLVTQSPASAFNRRRTLGHALRQAARVHRLARSNRSREELIGDALVQVGLTTAHLARRPPEVSGGELARMALARALMLHPAVLVLDEPTASLDAATTLDIVGLLVELGASQAMGMLVVTHELVVARRLATRTAILHRGSVVEAGTTAEVLEHPRQPITRQILADAPVADPTRRGIFDPVGDAGP